MPDYAVDPDTGIIYDVSDPGAPVVEPGWVPEWGPEPAVEPEWYSDYREPAPTDYGIPPYEPGPFGPEPYSPQWYGEPTTGIHLSPENQALLEELTGVTGVAGAGMPTLPPRDEWPEGFYPVWHQPTATSYGGYHWAPIPGALTPGELEQMTEAEKLAYELAIDRWEFQKEQDLKDWEFQREQTLWEREQTRWEQEQYGIPPVISEYQQEQVRLQDQAANLDRLELEWRMAQDGQLTAWQEEQLTLSREDLTFQRERVEAELAYQQERFAFEQEEALWERGLTEEQLALQQQQWAQQQAWEEQQWGEQLGWQQERFGQELGFEREQFEWQQTEAQRLADIQQQNYLAQLAAQPHSWLEYSMAAGEQPVIQPWMLPLMPQEYGMAGVAPTGAYPLAVPPTPPTAGPTVMPSGQAAIGGGVQQGPGWIGPVEGGGRQLMWNPQRGEWEDYLGQQGQAQTQQYQLPAPQYEQWQAGQAIPGWPEVGTMPELTTPSRQYQARMGPTALQQFAGYEQMMTGIRPEELEWRLWSAAPPGGTYSGLSYVR